ncbi:MAG: hypothetical protein IAE81_00235 [Caldilineaceae bacterium]|nr:hypothetical protein [Caldilineaceae bacterium]
MTNFADPADVARHDQMVALVERMLALHRQRQAARHTNRMCADQHLQPARPHDRVLAALRSMSGRGRR